MGVLRAACLSMLAAGILAEGQLRGSVAQRGDEGPYLEVPDEGDAENPKPEIAGWEKSLNATSLEASASYWGAGFCRAHHVGYWCQGFTRVRCCRNHWGFVRCGSFIHHRGCGWHGWGGGYHAGPYNEVAQGESNAEQSDEGPYLEVPDEAEAESPKPEIEGWEKKSLNATSLEPSTSGWGRQFCAAHHVGYFCRGFTRVRCCRNTWGFTRCGSFVHYRGCGWHGRGYGYNEVAQGDSAAAQLPETAAVAEDAGVYPDETTGYDEVGPFLAVPDESEAENPKPAIAGWDNSTSLQAAAFHSWGRSFCQVHHTGYFCDGVTRVRCCQQQWGFVKCGTTAHARSCGYRGGPPVVRPPVVRPSPWVIHPGWVQSSFCRAHHVGLFCYQHSRVHCCNDHGHFVQCTTRAERSFRC